MYLSIIIIIYIYVINSNCFIQILFLSFDKTLSLSILSLVACRVDTIVVPTVITKKIVIKTMIVTVKVTY